MFGDSPHSHHHHQHTNHQKTQKKQVDFLKLLHDKLTALHVEHADSASAIRYPRPSFKVVVLYIDEETSIKRQLTRAKVAQQHNRRVRDAGAGHFFEERSTDVDIDKCRKRYGIFKTHYAATLRLKRFFPFTLIDAMGSLAETREQITKELRYQSSLDLSVATYVMIRHLPLAKDIVRSARQELVMRLDGYCEANAELFREVKEFGSSKGGGCLRVCVGWAGVFGWVWCWVWFGVVVCREH